MNDLTVLHIGIAPRQAIRERTLAIARGELRPGPDEPRVWFSSVESLAKVLSEKNMLLLETIRRSRPQSLAELAKLSGRHVSNLSRTLHNMERFGLVILKDEDHRKVPIVPYETVKVELSWRKGTPSKAA